MPCGGIYPIAVEPYPCWFCDKPGPDHALDEWDAAIHGACVESYLKTEEGRIVVEHGHRVKIRIDGVTRVIQEET